MYEVDDRRDLDASSPGLHLDAVDLVVVAIHECDPGARVLGVAALSFVEDAADHRGGVFHHARSHPLIGGGGRRDRVASLVVVTGQDVRRRTRRRGDLIDAADLGHAFAAALLTLGDTGEKFGRGASGGLGGGGTQGLGTHHDALAVAGEDERIGGVSGGAGAGGVELLEVGGSFENQTLQLAFAEALPGAPLDRRDGVVEGVPRGFDRGESAQPVGLGVERQVQQGVGGMQVGMPLLAVGEPPDADLSEHSL